MGRPHHQTRKHTGTTSVDDKTLCSNIPQTTLSTLAGSLLASLALPQKAIVMPSAGKINVGQT